MVSMVCTSCVNDPDPNVIGVPQDNKYVLRGKELVRGLASCGLCHGAQPDPRSPLTGGRVLADKFGEVTAPNLTPDKETGLGDWSAQEIITAIRSSTDRDGKELSRPMHNGFEWMSDEDAISIVSYLKALPPIRHEVERREVSWFDRNIYGFFDVSKEQNGYVPEIDKQYKVEYGKYLAENIARNNQCFAPWKEDLAWYERWFQSSDEIDNSEHPFQNWTVDEIVYYLQTGDAPEGKIEGTFLDPKSCPTNFYRYASREDLEALATYLKAK